MSFKLFIGGLSFNTREDTLRTKFEEFGTVEEAVVITDRETGRSRGFGFVSFSTADEAENAVKNMNNAEFEGRTIHVNKAGERSEGGGSRGGGYRGGSRSDNYRSGGGSYRGGSRSDNYRSGGGSYGGTRSDSYRSGGYGGDRSGGYERRERREQRED